eukprot:m.21685 g.21685  ORF g.21685 m.21685 type:complete len:200 (+) comp8320_c0_seq1:106-705(+)
MASEDSVACQDMCFYCFDVLHAQLSHRPPPPTPDFTNDPYPLFVTWKTDTGRGLHLRGCIGTFDGSGPLHSTLSSFAIKSAIHDHRFNPITLKELKTLQCGISLLTNFENGKDYLDWDIGTHGIEIEFLSSDGQRGRATYLPEVAVEQGWTKLEAIDSLLHKGGFRGVVTDDVRTSIQLRRYQSEKARATFSEWQAARS